MAKKKPGKFILSDETVKNSYGFYISTSGISLDRFNANPVMLSNHTLSNENVIGSWQDIEVEGTQLLAVPNFDTEDDKAKLIAGKIERGFIKGASIGITFDREHLKLVGDNIYLTKCELYEASIVPVPSNQNSLRLYNHEGQIIKEDEVKQLCLSLSDQVTEKLNTKNNMKKIILSVAALMALGFKDQPNDGLDASDVEAKILGLSQDNAALKSKNDALELAARTAKEAADAKAKADATAKVDLAITQGKLPADKKDAFVQLGITSPDVLDSTLAAIPAKQDFAAGVTVPAGTTAAPEVKTMDDFQKLSLEAQLAFKANNPEAYKKIVE